MIQRLRLAGAGFAELRESTVNNGKFLARIGAMTDDVRKLRERLLAAIQMVPECGCWIWTGRTNQDGYGLLEHDGLKNIRAHRASWIAHRGDIPPGLKVLHRCDMPSCINPDHLWLGSQADNIRDMHSKKRGRNSSKTMCKLGHVFDAGNTIWTRKGRTCRTCINMLHQKYRRKMQ